ncbi:3-hydroxyacyl-ACP dehydratase FabZ family protein [Methylobacterium sp. Leaf87]|uniref:3-hydroxyacyl-ACP dehydratase FabZ family protein n=1 Tax=Methylobacterium sp. Leaf87 TaxID=1736243 RepID=UPI0009EAD7E5|nr:3-hydroxyacyl-ACP dehydratase FabZ family protein [Methylobacterium sp. Leaf87]
MRPEHVIAVVRRTRNVQIWPHASDAANNYCIDVGPVTDLLPHRDPFLLVDKILEADLLGQRLRAEYVVRRDNPIFEGHFPGDPVYPGVLLVETAGQTAVCLANLLYQQDEEIGATPQIRATRLHHASFFHIVRPGYTLEVQVAILELDSITCTFVGQVWAKGLLCCLTVGEFYVASS